MKSCMRNILSSAAMLGLLSLAGCAMYSPEHQKHHEQAPGVARPMDMKSGRDGGQMAMMDMDPKMKEMCGMHMQMMSSMTPEQHKAMMAEHIKKMPPEMMQKRMEMMQMEMQMMRERMSSQPAAK